MNSLMGADTENQISLNNQNRMKAVAPKNNVYKAGTKSVSDIRKEVL